MKCLITVLVFLLIAPIVGAIISGIDRKLTARMQGRFGPPILQPIYDTLKLLSKETLLVRRSQDLYIVFYLLFVIITGAIFFAGGDLLLVIFAITLAEVFFILGGFKSSSPYSVMGAQRELLQVVSYEPMLLFSAIGMYMVTKSFDVSVIATTNIKIIYYLPGIFLGLVYVLTIKLRKSPFDLSTSHHGHQEVVKGITTEYTGKALAMIELAHFYEVPIIMGFVYLFFSFNPYLALLACALVYFIEIIIDNTFARMKWQKVLSSSWIVAIIFGALNIIILAEILRGN